MVTNGLKAGWLALGHNELEGTTPVASGSYGADGGSQDPLIRSSVGGGGDDASSILPLIDSATFRRYSGTPEMLDVGKGADGVLRDVKRGRGAGEVGEVEASLLGDGK